MNKTMRFYLQPFLLFLLIPVMTAQPLERRDNYDISKDKVLYTVGYSHLDSEWNWDYVTTINEYIKNTMTENFYLFEKYPDYVFNFTGSRRYNMMKEYYPDMYARVKEYVKQGRWYVSGSSVDEGEVNVSAAESIVRQVLYGNMFFRKEFGVTSSDYMLPDCFGFLASMPTIWNHCGLLGFSTQKLTWRSAVGVPFNVGVWNGPDGKGIIAALNGTGYSGGIVPRLDLDDEWNKRIEENIDKYGISFDYKYYGVGDCAGAPRERDVKNGSGSIRNDDSRIKVILSSSDQMYKDITPEIRAKLPVYTGDLLLIEHSAGSLTSQAYMKRANRKNELLAQAAEQAATVAYWRGGAAYPQEKLNNSWDLVLGSQFHDILPGTSIPKAYEYAWNDEFIASNGFAEVLKNSVRVLAGNMDTRVKGRPVVVYNPVARDRYDIVTAEMEYDNLPADIAVFDARGREVLSQIIERNGNKLKFIFSAHIPSMGMAVYDVRETAKGKSGSALSVSDRSLENEYYRVTVDEKGDITSIVDKKSSRELLSDPAKLEFLHEEPSNWPAWNMDWNDRRNPPEGYMDEKVSVRVVEKGPVRVALEIKRSGHNSEITQIISLAAGEAGRHVEVTNKADWQSAGVSLKAAFPLSVSNSMATYNMGVGTIMRGNNEENKFEVPSKEWIDLTDASDSYGVSVLEDCKYGSDKPNDNTLRLTLLYTPKTSTRYPVQGSQDWGVHEFRYGIYCHSGDWRKGLTPWQAKYFNMPMMAFETTAHKGSLGREMSMLTVSTPQAGVMAMKKAEEGDYYIIRVNELFGNDIEEVSVELPGIIADAWEVNGQEQKTGSVDFSGKTLKFGLSHYTIRSFAVKLSPSQTALAVPVQEKVTLPYNLDGISYDVNRSDGSFAGRVSYPAEMLPEEITSEDIHFAVGNKADEQNNVVECRGQEIELPSGSYNKLYILASANDDITGSFVLGADTVTIGVQKWTGFTGQFYNRVFAADGLTVTGIKSPYSKTDNIAWFASHRHIGYPMKNDAYQYSYIYKYEIALPAGVKRIILPDNKKIKIFAMTVVNDKSGDVEELQPLYDDFAGYTPVEPR